MGDRVWDDAMWHPIVAQMNLSDEQKPAVWFLQGDMVVMAGAGAGKTRTLVARYLALLAGGLPLRSVVAITFTQKAAREMRNRVRQEVRRYLDAPQPARDGAASVDWTALYAELDAARIGTIHSLCAEILRAHPAEAGIDPQFEVLDEGQSHVLRMRAIQETLAWAADDALAAPLFALLGELGLSETLEAMLVRRADMADWLNDWPDDPTIRWQQHIRAQQQEVWQAVQADARWGAAADVLTSLRGKSGDHLEEQRRLALAALTGAARTDLTWAERMVCLSGLGALNLQGGSKAAWPGGQAQQAVVREALGDLRQLWRDHTDILGLALNDADAQLARAFPALRGAFAQVTARYEAGKQERQAVDFDDLEQGALRLLSNQPAARQRWQEQVRAILVDEFQDTNRRQRDLVQCLNGDQGRLFMVGDAKQSIYRFRGADVTVFRQERERIVASGGRQVDLAVSYRAHRPLVEGLNDLLRPVLGDHADPRRPWVAPFAPLEPHRQAAGAGFDAPHIELHLTVGSKESGALQRTADALAGRLIELVSAGPTVGGKGAAHPLNWGDVAILCRASTSFAAYEDALERAGVPFLTVSGRGFYGRPEVRDLLNALRALDRPTDDLVLVGLLRSPALALSDEALYRLSQTRQRAGSLWDALQQFGARLDPPDGCRAARAVQIIHKLRRQVGRRSVAGLLKAWLDETDYTAALRLAGQPRAARNVSKLLADAHNSGLVGVGEFLEYVDGLRDSGAREGEARAAVEGAVQIMTVHAAKGLEFPVIAIGDVGGGARRGRSEVLLDPDLGLLLPLKDEAGTSAAACALGQLRDQDQEQAESDRLFYVAATRAQDKLLLSGCISLKKDGTPGRLSGWLGQLAIPIGLAGAVIAHNPQGMHRTTLPLQVGQTPIACTIYEPGVEWTQWLADIAPPMTDAVILPPPLLGAVSAQTDAVDERVLAEDRSPPQRVWQVAPSARQPDAPAWVVGALTHEALAAWRFPDAESWAQFELWMRARARSYGLTDARQLDDAVRSCARLLRRFRQHALYAEMDGAARRLHEVPYSLMVDGQVENGIMDVLYEYGERWKVVEFKTDRVTDEDALHQWLVEKDYVAQVRRYQAAVRRLWGQQAQGLLCLLNYGRGEVRLCEVE